MAFLCVDLKFKQQYRHAWLYCITLMITIVCLTSMSFYNYSLFGKPPSMIFFGYCIIQNTILVTSLLSFTILLHNLRKRYKILNSFLRYVSPFGLKFLIHFHHAQLLCTFIKSILENLFDIEIVF